MNEINKKWDELLLKIEKQLNNELSLKGVLYLIGLQELNMLGEKFDRDEKTDVLHVAICKVLTPFGYYAFDRVDKDGWPHWKEVKAISHLDEKKQELLIKKAIIKYLNS